MRPRLSEFSSMMEPALPPKGVIQARTVRGVLSAITSGLGLPAGEAIVVASHRGCPVVLVTDLAYWKSSMRKPLE